MKRQREDEQVMGISTEMAMNVSSFLDVAEQWRCRRVNTAFNTGTTYRWKVEFLVRETRERLLRPFFLYFPSGEHKLTIKFPFSAVGASYTENALKQMQQLQKYRPGQWCSAMLASEHFDGVYVETTILEFMPTINHVKRLLECEGFPWLMDCAQAALTEKGVQEIIDCMRVSSPTLYVVQGEKAKKVITEVKRLLS